ncbi:amino acid/amide ABC transporter ATP-binding protein 1 (HAAT family) [Limimaricola soesokkakensis]|uniref:Amino acid/amide ABC transporter ATP-binding protein 1 (HAAT family) n=1 Tax=Limimaricola soesokkakensis TaxID=1343159 RepID=A0A1X6ZL05_9RHOB|nr:ABC transporter ATP-binding protein [Limimaricola soesokkakensis]PSK80243.1 amino acid/amide ABC transporter ATP-binding protein 1 (HAAT family) [Limimaricola soesokkakensis]SLN54429.1 Lipopolysaccharide export system ATP-binding protein LptB [Limimaricola soesokkakensis]
MAQILQLDGVSKSFGAVTVADGLSYGLAKGEALGVLGPNGAGKTSMFNLITGTLMADSGRISFEGEDITRMSAARRSRAGIARSFQVPQPFTHMTVFENAMVAATQSAGLSGREAERLCIDVLDQTELLGKANDRAGGLTLLNRKRLELTRALCAKPRLLLLDEIAGGLTEAECTSLIATIKSIHASGVSIIWIEHVVHALMAVVERLIVIDFGRKIAEGEPRAIMESPEVQEIYLGIEADA